MKWIEEEDIVENTIYVCETYDGETIVVKYQKDRVYYDPVLQEDFGSSGIIRFVLYEAFP